MKNNWIKVCPEITPKKNSDFLGYTESCQIRIFVYTSKTIFRDYRITYWQPLPEPPENKSAK